MDAVERRNCLVLLTAWADAALGQPPVVPLLIAAGETGGTFDPWAVGDGGASFGEIQVYTPVHYHDRAYWSGLQGTRRALREMRPDWDGAYQRHGPLPNDRAEQAAWFQSYWVAAQGCVQPTLEACQRAVVAAWAAVAERAADHDAPFTRVTDVDWAVDYLLPAPGPITQGFGVAHTDPDLLAAYTRSHPDQPYHRGIDIGCPDDTPVYAVAPGTFHILADGGSGYGLHGVITTPDDEDHIYAHWSAYVPDDGVVVARGDLIGFSGHSGFVTGAHLHFQRNVAGTDMALDPGAVLRVLPTPPPPPPTPRPTPPPPPPPHDVQDLLNALTLARRGLDDLIVYIGAQQQGIDAVIDRYRQLAEEGSAA